MTVARFFELVRFGTVTVLGLAVDLAVAWTLAVVFFLPLPLAAAVGFGFGALLNYLLHGMWTFGIGQEAFSARRVASYVVALALVLSVRIAAVAVLTWIIEDPRGYELAVLMAATTFSFVVNYLLSKYVVFRAAHLTDHLRRSMDVK